VPEPYSDSSIGVGDGDAAWELMALTWQHVDLDAGIVSVERSTAQLGRELVTTTPKNHERRKVQLDARTVAGLRAWRKVQAQERWRGGVRTRTARGSFLPRRRPACER